MCLKLGLHLGQDVLLGGAFLQAGLHALGYQGVDGAHLGRQELFESRGLVAVLAEVAGVEHPFAFGLDEEGEGLGGGMVHQIRRDDEAPEDELVAAAEIVDADGELFAVARHLGGDADDVFHELGHVDFDIGVEGLGQQRAVMVVMRVRDEQRQYGIGGFVIKPGDIQDGLCLGHFYALAGGLVYFGQRGTVIQQNARRAGSQFDAVPPQLFRPSVYDYLHIGRATSII